MSSQGIWQGNMARTGTREMYKLSEASSTKSHSNFELHIDHQAWAKRSYNSDTGTSISMCSLRPLLQFR